MKKIINLILAVIFIISCFTLPILAQDECYTGREEWKVSVNSEWSMNKINLAFDGNIETYWHSNYKAEGTTIVDQDKVPYEITVEFPETLEISGIRYTPRPLGMSDAGRASAYKLYIAENQGDTPVLVKEGRFEDNPDAKTVKLAANVKASKLVFEITAAKRNYGTMSEFDVLKPDSALSSKAINDIAISEEKKEESVSYDEMYIPYSSTWKISVNSDLGGNTIHKAFDGDIETFWHSDYKAEGQTIVSQDTVPYYITVIFPEKVSMSGFCYTPRPLGMSESGRARAYKFYIAENEEDEPVLVKQGEWENEPTAKTVNFPCNVKVSKIVFEITASVRNYGTMSELNFLKAKSDYDDVAVADFNSYVEDHLYYSIPRENMTAYSESVWKEDCEARCVLDDNTATFWHEKPGDKAPITLDIDLGEEYELLGFSYFPRKEPENKGQWKLYSMFTSLDGVKYEPVLEDARMDVEFKEVIELFDAPVRCRYVSFEINDFNVHCACADLQFFESAKDRDAREKESYEKYVMQIDNPVLKVTKGTAPEKEVTLDVAPYLDNGTTMIPLRGLLTEMGAEITWDGNTQSIGVDSKNAKVELQIMNTRVYVTTGQYGRVRYTLKGSAPKIKESRTFIPLRFVSENLGYNVTWDGETKTITVETKNEAKTVDVNN